MCSLFDYFYFHYFDFLLLFPLHLVYFQNLQKIQWEYHGKLASLKLLNCSLGPDKSLKTSDLGFRKDCKEIESSKKSVDDKTKYNVVNSNIEREVGLKLKCNLKKYG